MLKKIFSDLTICELSSTAGLEEDDMVFPHILKLLHSASISFSHGMGNKLLFVLDG